MVSAALNVHSVWFRFSTHKNAVLFFCTLALSAAATVANIKIRYDAKTPKFAIIGTRAICVFYSIHLCVKTAEFIDSFHL